MQTEVYGLKEIMKEICHDDTIISVSLSHSSIHKVVTKNQQSCETDSKSYWKHQCESIDSIQK